MNCLTKLFQQKRRRIGYILAFSGPMISKRDSSDFRYNSYISAGITEDNSASICRFGQTDIINTFINGINDNLKKALYDIFGNFTSQLKNLMINNVDTQYSKDIINSAIDEGKLVATLGATLDNTRWRN